MAGPVPDHSPSTVGSSASFRVRQATGLDADAMLSLIHSHAAYEGGEASISVAKLQSVLDQDPAPLAAWVADEGGKLVGYATATVDFSTWAGKPFLCLDCLFVQAGCRGSGVGAALLEAVRVHALDRRIAVVQWQTPDWNEDAIRFYLRKGASFLPKARFTLLTA